MSLGTVSIRRPTFIVAILLAVLTLGIVSYKQMTVRMMPDVEFPYVLVMTTYEGAGAAEVEQQVSRPIEDAISGISGIKHVRSTSNDNISIVMGEFNLSKNAEVAAQEVRDAIGLAVRALPDDIETPIVMKMDMNAMPVMGMSLKADMSPVDIYDFANNILVNELAQVDGVSSVNIIGGTKREIHVNADKKKIKDYQISLSAIAGKIMLNSLNVPAGSVDRGPVEMAYRTMGEFGAPVDINDVIVSFIGNDIPIKIRDIASVEDTRQKTTSIGRLSVRQEDGGVLTEPSLMLIIFKQAKSNDVKISDGLLKKLDDLNEKYKNAKGSPQLTLLYDGADGIRKNISDTLGTIVEGIILAIIVVYFFLGSWRSTFITALALPNSLIGACVFMYLAGFSINILSLMSLSLAVGLLIDDAIVVRENIFRHYQKGKDPVQASVDGVHEVTLAVVATTAAVIAVFTPVGFLGGMMGKFFREFGLTVVFAMTISILDALTIAPMLSAYIIPTHERVEQVKRMSGPIRNFSRAIVRVFRFLTVDWFEKIFALVLAFYNSIITRIARRNRFRLLTILTAVGILVFTYFIGVKNLKMSFMPSSDWGRFTIEATGKPGTSLEQMNIYSKQIEDMLMKDESIEKISSSVGSSGFLSDGSNLASYSVTMVDSKKRNVTTAQMRDKIREQLNEIYGDKIDFAIKASQGMGADSALQVELTGSSDLDLLYEVSRVLMERYKEIPYIADIHSNFQLGKPETQVRIDKVKMERMGINTVDAGKEIRAMIDGATAGKFRQNGNEYDIKVQLPESQKDIIKDLDNAYIYNVNNRLVSLNNVARLVEAGGPTAIYRKDKSRYISVEANLKEGGLTGPAQKEAVRIFNEEKAKPENAEKWKDIYLNLSGDSESMAEMMVSVLIAVGMALLFIFLVLASLYESIITPFVIMTALPFAIVGGIIALLVTDQPLDMFTAIGMVMLLGIVAKNSILLIDYAQQKIRGGMEISEALIRAGRVRFRPILMTSIALIAGMLPTALGLTEVGAFRKGMGIVVIGGIISSTILTLVFVPAVFEYMDRFRRFLRKLMGRPDNRMVDYTERELEEKGL
ncbi:MAG: efflux RND transporter permease subunit [Elusimicrobiota bacterium]|jgi:HAE1 family hydrophobic/amphiphilic exporter-1|nr:efflux RND transporter permease subunit [Elusimicrobiota bacterium]